MLIGLPSAVELGLLAGAAEFVPYFGPIFAAIPALLVALTVSNEAALLTPLTVVAYVMVKRLYVREALHTPTPVPGEKD